MDIISPDLDSFRAAAVGVVCERDAFFFEKKNYNSKVRNIVSQRFLHTTVRKKFVTSFCSIVHRPIVYGMHISMVDSVHIGGPTPTPSIATKPCV